MERISDDGIEWFLDSPDEDMRAIARELRAYRDSGALARSIAEALFTNGAGDVARRLVLELPDGRDGGGWCRKAVEDVIIAKLEAIDSGAVDESKGMKQ